MSIRFHHLCDCLSVTALCGCLAGSAYCQELENTVPATKRGVSKLTLERPGSESEGKGYLGLSVGKVSASARAQITLDEGFGLSVLYVVPGGPAASAGIQRYDILAAIDDQRLTTPKGLGTLAASRTPGETVALTTLRKGETLKIDVILGDQREAPLSLRPADVNDDSALLVESLLELLGRSEGLSAEEGGTSALNLQFEWNESISGILSDLRRKSQKEGIRFETLAVNQSTIITTTEMDIVVTSQNDGSAPWISAHNKEGRLIYTGPLGKDAPLNVRQIIERTRGMHQYPKDPPAATP